MRLGLISSTIVGKPVKVLHVLRKGGCSCRLRRASDRALPEVAVRRFSRRASAAARGC